VEVTGAPAGLAHTLARHWRGELGLGRSFWTNTNLVGAIALACAAGLISAASMLEAPPPVSTTRHSLQIWASLGLHLLAVGHGGLVLWQVVGLWRAAGAHIAATGNRLRARVTQAWAMAYVAGLVFAVTW
jgi:hypothetical protein